MLERILRAVAGALVVLVLVHVLPHSSKSGAGVGDNARAEAWQLFLTGKYAEGAEAYAKLDEQTPVEAALGQAKCERANGKHRTAMRRLEAIGDKYPSDARVFAELARLCFERGEHDVAKKHAAAALGLDNEQPLARWVQAELYRTSGKLNEANASYKWFVDYYNATDEIDDPETLRLIGRAAAQYARWNRLADQYRFLVDELYPDILRLEKNYWPAHFDAGLLFLEKFNQAEAAKQFNLALAINPNAAEVHAALAALAVQNYDLARAKRSIDRALAINPELLWAKQLQADVQLSNFDVGSAIVMLNEALKLNPRDEGTLGRLAAAYVARDGLGDILHGKNSVGNALRGGDSVGNALRGVPETPTHVATPSSPTERHGGRSLQKVLDEVDAQSAHAGEFYLAAGDALDKLRRYPAAGQFYEQAIERMPQLVAPYGQLGLIQMRLADETAAEKTLKRAFEIDPFNVRVSNSLEVLEVLSGYATIETEHFVIRFDRGQDEVLAREAARYLEEEVYPALSKQMGFEPEGKSLFEIFSRAKNTDGHGWFSARMVGLPYVGTVAACAGKVVAMQSPNDARTRFNWARTLRHEFVHVINLQQTSFGIPHWFTEALAVYHEELPRPESWNSLLADALVRDALFDLDTINGGFLRPKSTGEWNLAYCQAELYAEYMLDRFGEGALAKMLDAYAENLSTPAAIERSFGIDVDDFERGYREYVKETVEQNAAAADERRLSLPRLKALARELLKSGDDHEKLASVLAELAEKEVDSLPMRKKLAQLAFARKNWPEAERWAREAIYIDVKDADMHRIAGEAAAALGKPKDAIHSFELVLRLEEGNLDVRVRLIRAYTEAEQRDKARVELEALKKLAPGDTRIEPLEKQLKD